jgi:hypothetical protein
MVSGNFVEVEIEKYPLSFVYVPEAVPLIITDAAGMASFVVELRIGSADGYGLRQSWK